MERKSTTEKKRWSREKIGTPQMGKLQEEAMKKRGSGIKKRRGRDTGTQEGMHQSKEEEIGRNRRDKIRRRGSSKGKITKIIK
jgi:hypothetical protein